MTEESLENLWENKYKKTLTSTGDTSKIPKKYRAKLRRNPEYIEKVFRALFNSPQKKQIDEYLENVNLLAIYYLQGVALSILYTEINPRWTYRTILKKVISKRKCKDYQKKLNSLKKNLKNIKKTTIGFEDFYKAEMNRTQSLIFDSYSLYNLKVAPSIFFLICQKRISLKSDLQQLKKIIKVNEDSINELKKSRSSAGERLSDKDEEKKRKKSINETINESLNENKNLRKRIKSVKVEIVKLNKFFKKELLFDKSIGSFEKLCLKERRIDGNEIQMNYDEFNRKAVSALIKRKLISREEGFNFIINNSKLKNSFEKFQILSKIFLGFMNGFEIYSLNDIRFLLSNQYSKANKSLLTGYINPKTDKKARVSFGSYKRHHIFATDINVQSGTKFYNVYKERIQLPYRFNVLKAFNSTSFNFISSTVSKGKFRDDTPAGAIFSKLGRGFGYKTHRLVQLINKSKNDESFSINSDLLKKESRKQITNKSVYVFLTGLIFIKIYQSSDLPTNLDKKRIQLKNLVEKKLNQAFKESLNLDYYLNRVDHNGNVGNFGRRQLLSPKIKGKQVQQILVKVKQLLSIDDSIRTNLWTLLLYINKNHNVEPHLGGVGLTIDYLYTNKEGEDLLVEIYHTHLQEINLRQRQTVSKEELIGKVGATGSAKSPHNHVEMRVYKTINIDGKKINLLLGALLPHEWYQDELKFKFGEASSPSQFDLWINN